MSVFETAFNKLRPLKSELDVVLEAFVDVQDVDNGTANLPASKSMARYTIDMFELFWQEQCKPKCDVSPDELKVYIETLQKHGYTVKEPK